MSDRLAVEVEGPLRARPLVPTALYVEGTLARSLARALAQRDALDTRLVGVAARDGSYLVLSGPSDSLPWIDGARWLGIDPEAPRLRVSTTRAPALRDGTVIAASVLERAILARVGPTLPGPFALTPARLIPLGMARPLDRARLLAVAEGRDVEGTAP